MKELSINEQLSAGDLFQLFREQLRKDFEISGIDVSFIESLPRDLELLQRVLTRQLQPLFRVSSGALSSLLYRIDISESNIAKYMGDKPDLKFEEVIVELIIKRILQKVVLKKKYSQKSDT